ncbi:proline, histidine and glycine-rich protein 1-like [Tachyglossus aculeatus]|uniref:proline, histidine and glycine-rich protein 1-like n=1 Tax=Tachyglossus aculeatus TaxID=9261 RepID=UPI0018F558EF|nr:proline, histidine and glycine-rich protein 1-like [Tachyglossus aculeatus]XP_038604856.1 proline, histidine and glycine-rich protein 1-like [Tachyglossus aculeatus]
MWNQTAGIPPQQQPQGCPIAPVPGTNTYPTGPNMQPCPTPGYPGSVPHPSVGYPGNAPGGCPGESGHHPHGGHHHGHPPCGPTPPGQPGMMSGGPGCPSQRPGVCSGKKKKHCKNNSGHHCHKQGRDSSSSDSD